MFRVKHLLLALLVSAGPLLATQFIVVDPGHGGPNGGKYGENGDGEGSEGQYGLTEEWVNLQVSVTLDSLIDTYWWIEWMNSLLTRATDTNGVELWQRVQIAKDSAAIYFLSVHHNGWTNPETQGTEVFWSSRPTDDSGNVRVEAARDSMFAKKLLLRLITDWDDTMHNRCAVKNQPSWMHGCDEYQSNVYDKFVVKNINHCAVALSEASFLTDPYEEDLFADEESGHAEHEAEQLYHGTHSHYYNAGIAQISNRYINGPGQQIGVDALVHQSPVEFTWEVGESHSLYAWENFYQDPHTYTFHHWAHWEPGEAFPTATYEYTDWDITVPFEEGYHIYRAYFTGGPYWADINYLPWPLSYKIGDTLPIYWQCRVGVDSTSEVDVYLDRHNGDTDFPENIGWSIPYDGWLDWVVTGPSSDSCRIKIWLRDIAGNEAVEISEDMFSICGWLVGDANGDGDINVSDHVYIIN